MNTRHGEWSAGPAIRFWMTLPLVAAVAGCQPAPTSSQGRTPAGTAAPKDIEFIVFSDWSMACRDVPPVIDMLRSAHPAVKFRELNIDEGDNAERWRNYGSDSVPCYYVIADGEVIARNRGFLAYGDAEEFLRGAVERVGGRGER